MQSGSQTVFYSYIIMTKIHDFENLDIWKMTRRMANFTYADFKICKDYSFKDQIQRCAVSAMNNIAEGFCRKGDKEFHYFLKISYASCGELKSMYYLAEDLGYLTTDLAIRRRESAQATMNAIGKLKQYLKKK